MDRYYSDNEYGIPCLDIEVQSKNHSLKLPFVVWGEFARSTSFIGGTVAFYVDDYRFSKAANEPLTVAMKGFSNACEMNFSVGDDTTKAEAIWATYRKRQIARIWQAAGLSILADLHVAARWQEINALGIPQGWEWFCTRGSSARLDDLDSEYAVAASIACKKPFLVVYGGGKAVEDWCMRNGCVHVLDRLTRARRSSNG